MCSLVNLLLTTLRTTVFYAGFVVLTATASTVTCLLFFLPFRLLQRIATVGNLLVMQWLRLTCNIKIVVSGKENIPAGACVVLSNHQSTWEAFYMQWFFSAGKLYFKARAIVDTFFWLGAFLNETNSHQAL